MQDRIKSWNLLPKADEDIVASTAIFTARSRSPRWATGTILRHGLALYNGRIWHGFQYQDPARHLEPTTYYVDGTGAALSVDASIPSDGRPGAEGRRDRPGHRLDGRRTRKEGDKFYFYDIDPKIVKFANEYFTYLDKSPAKPKVDARRRPDQ